MTLGCVLIDDEQNNLDNLAVLLERHCPAVRVLGMAGSAAEGKQLISKVRPDLVFLDIQMPGESGFDLLKSLPNLSFEVIFVTAHDQYGIQAIKFSAIDYLLKPIRSEELEAAVAKVVSGNASRNQNLQLENLVRTLQSKEPPRIALSNMRETRFIRTDSIVCCESSNNYTNFSLEGGEKIISTRPIYEYEELLSPYGFIRCHQSFLVNRQKIRSWVKEDGGYLLMDNGARVPVSRVKKDEVRRLLR